MREGVQGPSDADASEYSMPSYLPATSSRQLLFAQMLSFGRVYNRSCSVPPTVPVHLYELVGAGTLFANNQRCRYVVALRPKALRHMSSIKLVPFSSTYFSFTQW